MSTLIETREHAPALASIETAEIISLDARRVSRALAREFEREDVAIDYGMGQF